MRELVRAIDQLGEDIHAQPPLTAQPVEDALEPPVEGIAQLPPTDPSAWLFEFQPTFYFPFV